ncbi:ComF family protein [Nitratireductor pacificus]|uniref:Phosphoribosyltransferase n=1 Tax=Nitratireductor pacificus pht-3B TaxID=391937 RepID=K2N0K5_9HYPH|nr:ComF family protein [Nitratireductor pacificus]EKF17758.1 phosphoribosyltransferase [Nitratireductor pacificus pht-3B]
MLGAAAMFSVAQGMSAAVRWTAGVLFPPVCLGCANHVTQPGTLCASCWPRLHFLERPWCAVMGTPFSIEMGEEIVSADAIANPPPFARARSAVLYQGIARQMVQGLKFRDRTDLAPWMARWMLRAGAELTADADAVIPVPLHRARLLTRRFNQSAELARAVARQGGLDYAPEALLRVKKTRQQVGLGAREREANVRGAFRVPEERLSAVSGRRIILIDDVYTTGATVSAAARVLKRAGARRVDVLTFARVLPGDFRPDEGDPI